jgi:hypothetical protein
MNVSPMFASDCWSHQAWSIRRNDFVGAQVRANDPKELRSRSSSHPMDSRRLTLPSQPVLPFVVINRAVHEISISNACRGAAWPVIARLNSEMPSAAKTALKTRPSRAGHAPRRESPCWVWAFVN